MLLMVAVAQHFFGPVVHGEKGGGGGDDSAKGLSHETTELLLGYHAQLCYSGTRGRSMEVHGSS